MDIEDCLVREHSKSLSNKINNYIGSDSERFKELMLVFLNGDTVLEQRAAWTLSDIGMQQPQLIKPYMPQLLEKIGMEGKHPAVARNILRIFQTMEIPEIYCGRLLDLCLGFIKNETKTVAIRAFSISVAANIVRRYPEIKHELLLLLEDISLSPQTPAIRVRIRSALKALLKT
jgi:hypothetical protein